jgi:hypothetical protein
VTVATSSERISVPAPGPEGDGWSFIADLSDDGRYIAFRSRAANLVPGDTNAETDLFVHDRLFGVTARGNRRSGGGEPPGQVLPGLALCGDGRFAGFTSLATGYSPEPVYLHNAYVDRAAPLVLALDWRDLFALIRRGIGLPAPSGAG